MSKTRSLWKAIAFWILAILAFVGCLYAYVEYQRFLKGCAWWECVPKRSFDVLDLELPRELLPSQAPYRSMEIHYPESSIPRRRGIQNVEWERGDLYYAVTLHPTEMGSSESFEFGKEIIFNRTGYNALWAAPPIKPLILSANDHVVHCGLLNNNRGDCTWIARYREFEVYFSTTIDDEMTIKDFQEIVGFIDSKFTSFLYEKQ